MPRRLIPFLLALALLAGAAGAQSPAPPSPPPAEPPPAPTLFSLTCTTDRSEYALGDTAWLTVRLENLTAEPQKAVELRFDKRSLSFDCSMGERKFNFGVTRSNLYDCDWPPLDLLVIPPKGAVQAVVDCPLIKPGDWTFTGVYQGTPSPVRSAPAKARVAAPEVGKDLLATIATSKGNVVVRFFPDDAPNTVMSFIRLIRGGFYTNRIFHRVIKGFVIQGGCPFGNGQGGPGYTLPAEFNKRKHVEGVLSMARTSQPDTAGSQFFICLGPQTGLDEKYTVFGEVAQGIEVVRAIGDAETTKPQDRPVTDQKIVSMSVDVN